MHSNERLKLSAGWAAGPRPAYAGGREKSLRREGPQLSHNALCRTKATPLSVVVLRLEHRELTTCRGIHVARQNAVQHRKVRLGNVNLSGRRSD
jgi:hypothetical protein